MKIQIGTISYRNKQTNEFEESKPLFAEATESLILAEKLLMRNACEMHVAELLNFNSCKTSKLTTKNNTDE